jgi:hypothetical protein
MAEERENQHGAAPQSSGYATGTSTGAYGQRVADAAHLAKEYGRVRESASGVAEVAAETEEDAELKALIAECVANVERAREKMIRDQVEIDRLKSETRVMIARLLAA